MKKILVIVLFLSACGISRPTPDVGDTVVLEERLQQLLGESTELMRRGETDRAFAALELARDLSPEDPRVLDGLGCVEWRRKNYRSAKYFFQRALAANPRYDRAYTHLALVAEREGDRQAAVELLQIAVKLNPLNFRSRNNLAVALLEKGDRKAYHQLLKAVEAGGRKDVVIQHNLGRFE